MASHAYVSDGVAPATSAKGSGSRDVTAAARRSACAPVEEKPAVSVAPLFGVKSRLADQDDVVPLNASMPPVYVISTVILLSSSASSYKIEDPPVTPSLAVMLSV
jgi:hypothetical protein